MDTVRIEYMMVNGDGAVVMNWTTHAFPNLELKNAILGDVKIAARAARESSGNPFHFPPSLAS